MLQFSPRYKRPYGTSSDVTARAISELGGIQRVSFTLCRAPSTVAAWTLDTAKTSIPYDRAQEATKAGAVAFVEDLAGLAGGVFMPMGFMSGSFAACMAEACQHFGTLAAGCGVPEHFPRKLDAEATRQALDETIHALVAARACLINATLEN